MAEIAGLVLGGIPIAIWALDKYAEPLETYHHYRTTISTIRTDLDLQRIQFEATLRSVGLQNPSPVEIQECLEGKFPGTHQVLIDIIKAMDERMSKLLGDLEIDINGKVRLHVALFECPKQKLIAVGSPRNSLTLQADTQVDRSPDGQMTLQIGLAGSGAELNAPSHLKRHDHSSKT